MKTERESRERVLESGEAAMVSISLYRGNLHRVSDAPRRYPMPPRAITLDQFRILTRKRDEALARLAAANRNPNPSSGNKMVEEEEAKVKEEKKEEGVEEGDVKIADVSDPQQSKPGEEATAAEDSKPIDADAKGRGKSSDADAVKRSEIGTTEAKPEVHAIGQMMMMGCYDIFQRMEVEASQPNHGGTSSRRTCKPRDRVSSSLNTEKEKWRIEVEKKLEVLKHKKHHLVQVLKQILNVEEEIKRRNAQSAALRSSIPLQAETAIDMGSATWHVPKLSVEVNSGGDLGAESDATANHSAHRRQMHHVHGTSPSAASLTRPTQQNTFLSTPRSSLVTSGQGQTSSNVGNTAAATSSPSLFVPTGHQGLHHSASLPPVSVPGSRFMASSPSPAASGGASSAFRDSHLTSSS